jgi:methionyl-tRNA synthetase
MVEKYRGGVVPDAPGGGLQPQIAAGVAAARGAMVSLRIHEAFAAAMDLARSANGYIEETEPWALAKDPARSGELDECLASLTRALIALGALLHPAIPARARELTARVGFETPPPLAELTNLPVGGVRIRRGEALFPRIEAGGEGTGGAPNEPASGA